MDNQEHEIPPQVETTQQSPELNSGVIRQSMDLYLQNAEQIEQSPEEYKRESYERAVRKIEEVELYIEKGVVSREEGNKIIAGEWAQTEIDGLIDPLTFTLNKKGFDERLRAVMGHAVRTGEPVTVAYLDLKGFKAVNDTIGHLAGDKVLLYVADFLRLHATQRADDFISRIGGDEFLIGFPLGDEQSIREKLSPELLEVMLSGYIHDRMSQEGIAHGGTQVSARIGVASAQPNDTVDSIKDRADQEMNAQRDPNEPSSR